MFFDPQEWLRLEWDTTPVYVRPDPPCWFVPNDPGDRLLREALKTRVALLDGEAARFFQRLPEPRPEVRSLVLTLHGEAARFFQRLPEPQPPESEGGSPVPRLTTLKELWLHVTNRCNLACRHCLFASSPSWTQDLPAPRALDAARQAYGLGCRLFVLTGGEPVVHPDFSIIVDGILALPDTHVVVLTNGLAADSLLENRSWSSHRLHLQVSLDGLEEAHDALRRPGAFDRTVRRLRRLSRHGLPFTISVCPTRRNLSDIPSIPALARDLGAENLHFMWYFVRGRAVPEEFVPADELFAAVRRAVESAESLGVGVDNVRALASQIFSPPGTRYDRPGMAWESLALGSDDRLYPSAALVGVPELAVAWGGDLASAWKQSPVFESIRRKTVASSDHPLRFFLGGGDPDHSYLACGRFTGGDPYLPFLEKMALWLIARRAATTPSPVKDRPALRLKMGDVLESCGVAPGGVAFTHSNCLLALSAPSSLTAVRELYTVAATTPKTDMVNPVGYPQQWTDHIPEAFRFRGYGCGSPVADAALKVGETVVDVGCGTGVECFIAARQVGPTGRVIGIDMVETMLDRAKAGAEATAANLGYANMVFFHAMLESLPLETGSADVVLSNCVLNLSTDKRRAFQEIHRILRPGGRLVVSDVVCDQDPGAAVRNDPLLYGECVGGALTQRDLAGLLEESGFGPVRFLRRFPYRRLGPHVFHSLTFEARKPSNDASVPVIYPGPFAAVHTFSGAILRPGPVSVLPRQEAEALQDHLFLVDASGAVTNRTGDFTCACSAPESAVEMPPAGQPPPEPILKGAGSKISIRRRTGCMVCGAPLSYEQAETRRTCAYCRGSFPASVQCTNGHFVCDACHSQDAIAVIEHLCLSSTETDLIALMDKIRRHPALPIHGPEHHALVPAVIVTVYRNRGGAVTDEHVRTALRRGSRMPGGSCGFMGCCGAAVGVGVAFSVLLEATPVKGGARRLAQQATLSALADIAAVDAARCCQREAWTALKKAAALSEKMLDVGLNAEHPLTCRQQAANPHCAGAACPVTKSLNGHGAAGTSA